MQNFKYYSPPLTKINKFIIILSVASFLVSMFGLNLSQFLGLSPAMIMSNEFYRFITYIIPQKSFMEMLFNALIIWFIGGEIEMLLGRKKYLSFLIVVLIVSALFYFLLMGFIFRLESTITGTTGLCYALLVAYALYFSDRYLSFMLLFPMKAKYFALLLIGIEIYFSIATPGDKSSVGHILAIVVAFLYLRWKKLTSIAFFKRKRKSSLYIVKNENVPPKNRWH